jgi:hypothetical protein
MAMCVASMVANSYVSLKKAALTSKQVWCTKISDFSLPLTQAAIYFASAKGQGEWVQRATIYIIVSIGPYMLMNDTPLSIFNKWWFGGSHRSDFFSNFSS